MCGGFDVSGTCGTVAASTYPGRRELETAIRLGPDES
jgi:hypothetical protein